MSIEKSFPGVRALSEVDLAIDSGEFFTLLGPSGCGKTTLLRIVAGFYEQDRGSVLIDGKKMDRVPAFARNTGMVFQNYAVFPHMSVFENVAFGLRNRRVAAEEIKRRVERVLAMARLTGYERRTPDQLSGGQQQRVGLARAMVIEPQVLLMDEPLSNLDAKLRVEMRGEIRDIQRELGTTTIYVTHDQEEALVISDRIAVMNGGIIEQVGTPWQIYKRPETVFVASFVGHMNFFDGELASSPRGPLLRVGGDATPLPAGAPPEIEGGELLVGARPEDIQIRDGGLLPESPAYRLSCVVEQSTFTGSLILYSLLSDSGIRLTAERHRPEREGIIRDGSRVTAVIEPDSMHLFDPANRRRIAERVGK